MHFEYLLGFQLVGYELIDVQSIHVQRYQSLHMYIQRTGKLNAAAGEIGIEFDEI
jgi:hypothetical protein